jgi:hypothetical protein
MMYHAFKVITVDVGMVACRQQHNSTVMQCGSQEVRSAR